MVHCMTQKKTIILQFGRFFVSHTQSSIQKTVVSYEKITDMRDGQNKPYPSNKPHFLLLIQKRYENTLQVEKGVPKLLNLCHTTFE